MSTLELLTGRNYLSYSALSSYLDCGERFRLERVMNAPQQKAWWFIGGSAFHYATEYLDLGEHDSPDEAWATGWDRAVTEAELDDYSKVRAGGRVSKEWPNKENHEWWAAKGPGMVQAYADWMAERKLEGWQLLDVNGQPAVEVPVQVEFPDVLVKGFIDRIMVNDAGEVMVIDLKTGSHTPASTLQLGIYALGAARNIGVTPTLGSYYMARSAALSEPRSLLHYTHELVGSWFAKAKHGIEAELFIPHVTSQCGTCSVAQYCAAVGGTAVVPGHFAR